MQFLEDAEYHNAVFVGTDEHGVTRHAQKRSTNSQAGPKNSTWRAATCNTAFTTWGRMSSLCLPVFGAYETPGESRWFLSHFLILVSSAQSAVTFYACVLSIGTSLGKPTAEIQMRRSDRLGQGRSMDLDVFRNFVQFVGNNSSVNLNSHEWCRSVSSRREVLLSVSGASGVKCVGVVGEEEVAG